MLEEKQLQELTAHAERGDGCFVKKALAELADQDQITALKQIQQLNAQHVGKHKWDQGVHILHFHEKHNDKHDKYSISLSARSGRINFEEDIYSVEHKHNPESTKIKCRDHF